MVKDLCAIAAKTKYPVEAFLFVQRGLDYTVRKRHGEPKPDKQGTSRHVTGHDLCLGLRDFAIKEYGLLARSVLRRWHINSCEDFGHIVFTMVENGLMQKTDEDHISDFVGVFDFAEAFSPQLSLR